MADEQEKSLQATIERLTGRIDRQNELLDLYIRNQTSVKARLKAGLWTGFGTVIGATLLVSLVVLALKPLAKTDWIGPIVDKVITVLENRSTISRPHRSDRASDLYNSDAN